ncbi:MAG: GNAT family N-acetyltransferase, partial [Duncaniella sp.]|nr:GNAT family N-acetyltransferase [Duncaniella sp.]
GYDGDIFSARQLRLMIVADTTGDTVGTVDLYDFDPVNSRCGVGILIAQPYRRRGYALRALGEIADYCRSRLSLHQLWCVVGADNHPSRELFARAGYVGAGCLRSWLRSAGRYTDAYILQLML